MSSKAELPPQAVVYAHSDDRLNDLVEMQRKFLLTTHKETHDRQV